MELRNADQSRGRSRRQGRLTARSVIASTLLGMQPPRLSTRMLVRSGELFGIAEGTTRVAISRMVAAGELNPDDDGHRLAGPLLTRQARQGLSRSGRTRRWRGSWRTAVVTADGRSLADRTGLRAAMDQLRLAELREGVWLRPDNLPAGVLPGAEAVIDAQCRWLASRVDDPGVLAAELWALDGWSRTAVELGGELRRLVGALRSGDVDALAPAFVLSASVLRHFQADPLLPPELLPGDWPGPALRSDYDRYDAAFKTLWRTWYREATTHTSAANTGAANTGERAHPQA